MAFEVVRAAGCARDLEAIFDQLSGGYLGLGDTLAEALARAGARVRSIEATMAGLGRTSFLGRPRPDLLPGLRQVATDRTVFSFVVDAPAGQVRVLAIYAGRPEPAAAAPGAARPRPETPAGRSGWSGPPGEGFGLPAQRSRKARLK